MMDPHEQHVHERAEKLKHSRKSDEDVMKKAKKFQVIVSVFLVSMIFFVLLSLGLTLREGQNREEALAVAREERLNQINEINQVQCESLERLYRQIRLTVAASDKAIDSLGYYKTHPEEAARAHAVNRRTLARFQFEPCPKDIVVPTD